MRKLKLMGRYFGIPFFSFLVYFLFCMFLSSSLSGSIVMPMVIGDGVAAVLMGLLYYRLCVKRDAKRFRFNGWSKLLLVVLFVVQYVFGQAVSSWVGIHFPSVYMQAYQSLTDSELMLYLVLSVTLAPIAEELLFRGLWYKLLRERFSVMFCFIVSSLGFGLLHGTTEHLPMTLALSLFICFVFEITGSIRSCIVIHMLANLVGIAYIIQIPVSYAFCIVGFLIYCAIMFVLLAAVPVLRNKMRFCSDKPSFTDRLEEKRKHWGDTL